jgi:hypothetical protein
MAERGGNFANKSGLETSVSKQLPLIKDEIRPHKVIIEKIP